MSESSVYFPKLDLPGHGIEFLSVEVRITVAPGTVYAEDVPVEQRTAQTAVREYSRRKRRHVQQEVIGPHRSELDRFLIQVGYDATDDPGSDLVETAIDDRQPTIRTLFQNTTEIEQVTVEVGYRFGPETQQSARLAALFPMFANVASIYPLAPQDPPIDEVVSIQGAKRKNNGEDFDYFTSISRDASGFHVFFGFFLVEIELSDSLPIAAITQANSILERMGVSVSKKARTSVQSSGDR